MCDPTMTNNKMDVSGDKHRMDVTQGVSSVHSEAVLYEIPTTTFVWFPLCSVGTS